MPVSKTQDSDHDNRRGHKRPRSQMSTGSVNRSHVSQGTRGHVSSPPARPGSWSGYHNMLGGGGGAGPTINIPDSRYGFSSPRASNRYGQVIIRNIFIVMSYYIDSDWKVDALYLPISFT